MRADARRSRAKLLEAATAAFAEHGADAPLDDIARRAGVGIGTLYRHFPTRIDLQAAVYRSQVQTVCDDGRRAARQHRPPSRRCSAGCMRWPPTWSPSAAWRTR